MKVYSLDERTIGHILRDKAESRPDGTYLVMDDVVVTYADVERLTNEFAAGLAGRGVGKGHHVALMMDNCPEYLWVTYALGKLGAVAVPLNTAAKGQLL